MCERSRLEPSPRRALVIGFLASTLLALCPSCAERAEPAIAARAPSPTRSEALPPMAELYAALAQALQAQDFASVDRAASGLMQHAPGHPGLMLLQARAAAERSQPEKALVAFERAAELGATLGPPYRAALATVAARADLAARLAAVRARFDGNAAETGASELAFEMGDGYRDLAPEGIARDDATGRVFVGSLKHNMIVVTDRSGQTTRFAAEARDPLPILGLLVDPRRNRLWAATSATDTLRARVVSFDLGSGNAVSSTAVATKPGEKHLLNDLVLTPGGLFITDSEAACVHRLDPDNPTRLTPLRCSERLFYPNGIAASADGRVLYVAHFAGIARIRTSDGELSPVPGPPGAVLYGIDGLYRWDRDLIAVQNGAGMWRITRMRLSPEGTSIVAVEPLLSGHPDGLQQTTAAIAGPWLYFLRFSPWSSPPEALVPPRVHRLRLPATR